MKLAVTVESVVPGVNVVAVEVLFAMAPEVAVQLWKLYPELADAEMATATPG